MTVPLLDLTRQYHALKDLLVPRLLDLFERQQFIMGPEVAELEQAFTAVAGTAHAVSCASGTDALLLPLKALGLQPGDEVITTPFTFFATAGAVVNAGGTPVFADIDPATFLLDPEAVRAAITPRTRAIIAVHLFGQMAPMAPLRALADAHGLALIEDAAQAVGARQLVDGVWRRAGELGWAGTFSFFPSKNLGGYGDGGMMVTQDAALAARLARLRTHGGSRQYYHEDVGTNSRLDTVQAVVLLTKLPFLAQWSAARRARAERYRAALAGVPGVEVPITARGNEHIYHQYTLRTPAREALRRHLTARGIGTAVYYPLALHQQPCFASLGIPAGSLPAAERAAAEVLSLPVFPELTDAEQDRVIEAIHTFVPEDRAAGAA